MSALLQNLADKLNKILDCITWITIKKYKDIFLFKVHAVWLILIPLLTRGLGFFNINTFSIETCPPRLWLVLYLASLTIFLARIVYELRCPYLIKEFETFVSFHEKKLTPWHIREDLYSYFDKEKTDNEFNTKFDTWGSVYSSIEHDKMCEYFNYAICILNKTRIKSRAICSLLYGISIILISYYIIGNIVCQLRTI